MTLRERYNAERPWLKTQLLVVTKQLKNALKRSNVSEQERRSAALVQHIILRDCQDVQRYHNVYHGFWENQVGKHYRTTLEWLVKIKCLAENT